MSKSPWENKQFTEMSLSKIDEKFASNTNSQVEYLINNMNLVSGNKVIDLGCGAGRHSIEFAKHGLFVTGIDISETMIDNAKRRTKAENLDVTYFKCDLAELSTLNLINNKYNGAICLCESGVGVLGSENKDYCFFEQVYNLLLPNSYFALTCFNSLRRYIRSKDQNPKFDYINSIMAWSCPQEIGGELLSEDQRQYTPSEIKMLLTLCGFSDIKVLSCKEGIFSDDIMGIEDIEMLVLAKKE